MSRNIVAGVAVAASLHCTDPRPERDAPPPAPEAPIDRAAPPSDPRRPIMFLGTSLTAGLGVEPDEAYPALIGDTLEALGLPYRAVNAGRSGETSAGGRRRLRSVLDPSPAALVVELGANDGLRGLPVEGLRANLRAIVEDTRAHDSTIAIVLVGMRAPPNLGVAYTSAFDSVFAELADAYDVALVPFLLDGVGGLPQYNQTDGMHPNPAGHRIMARHVWRILAPLISTAAEAAR